MSLPNQKRNAFDRLGWALNPNNTNINKLDDATVLWDLADQERDANYDANLKALAEVTAWGEEMKAWGEECAALANKYAARLTELEELEDESLAVDRAIKFLEVVRHYNYASMSGFGDALKVVAKFFEKASKGAR